jgi:hypothetical protein
MVSAGVGWQSSPGMHSVRGHVRLSSEILTSPLHTGKIFWPLHDNEAESNFVHSRCDESQCCLYEAKVELSTLT